MPFSSATLLAVCAFASFAGFLFLNALYLQQVRGLSAFHTGLCTLPLAVAITGRQVGAALGVAVAGTVVTASRAMGSDFAQATHPIWWIMTGCGAVVLLLGWASTTSWAHASTERVAALLGHSGR